MRPHPVTPLPLLLLPFLALSLFGCSEETSWALEVDTLGPNRSDLAETALHGQPGGSDNSSQPFDLHVGNRWEYERSFTFYFLEDGPPTDDPFIFRAEVIREVTGTTEKMGRRYFVYREEIIEPMLSKIACATSHFTSLFISGWPCPLALALRSPAAAREWLLR